MSTFTHYFSFLVGITSVAAVMTEGTTKVSSNKTNLFKISGMHCAGCARGIASDLKNAPGVESASVTFSNRLAIVIYDTNRISIDGLKKVIGEAGYEGKLVLPRSPKSHSGR